MIGLFKMFGWPSTQHSINTGKGSNGGFSGAYGWRRWEQWCQGYDMLNGKILNYQDGHEDGDLTVNKDSRFLDFLNEANKRINEKDIVTDATFGCSLSEDGQCKLVVLQLKLQL